MSEAEQQLEASTKSSLDEQLVETLRDPWIQGMVDKLVTHDLPMSRASEAFELLNQKEAGKVFFRPGE